MVLDFQHRMWVIFDGLSANSSLHEILGNQEKNLKKKQFKKNNKTVLMQGQVKKTRS